MDKHQVNMSSNMTSPIFNTTLSVIINVSDVTKANFGHEERRVYVTVLETFVLTLVWMISIPTNVLVCVVIYRSRRVQSTTNYFVVSLAVSDLVLSVFCVPFLAHHVIAGRWLLGSIMCRIIRFIQTMVPTTSVFVLVTISVDRFYTIIYPLSFKITRGTAKHLIACCWIISFALCVFSIYFYETGDNSFNTMARCPTFIPNGKWASFCYGGILILFSYIIPIIFVSVVYSRIFRYVWTAGTGHRRFRRTMNPVPRTKVKMLKMLIIVSVATFVLISPYYIVHLWYTFSSLTYVNDSLFFVAFLVMYTTTISKPIIYVVCNANFRRGCKEVFCMSQMKCYRSNTYAITTASNFGKKNHVGVMPTEHGLGALRSPSMAFNRSVISDRTSWPLTTNISSTYI